MLELSRTVRFCVNDPPTSGSREAVPPPRHNTFSAWPPMRGLGRFYQVRVRCRGEADPVTGYFINIKHIDEAVRERVLPLLQDALTNAGSGAAVPMGELVRRSLAALREPLRGAADRLTLELTPFHALEARSRDMDHVIVRQQFEFSAAHRLHVATLSDTENREVFGKCNNPSGHGHNYKLEVAVRAPIERDGGALAVEDLDAVVDEAVIQKLDHKHLNRDVPEFATLNPSVENIAKVIHGMLASAVKRLRVELDEISVWETSKTVCTYRGVRDGSPEGNGAVERSAARA